MAKKKPGKWSNLKGQYPAAKQLEGEGDWFDMVREELKTLDGVEVGELMAQLTSIKKAKAQLEAKVSEHNAWIKAREMRILEFLEKQKVDSVRDGDGGLFYKQEEPAFKIADQQKVDEWIDEQGYDTLRTINAQTLKGLLKKALEAGTDLPDGVDVEFATLLRSPKP